MEPSTFESIHPSRYITFTIPDPSPDTPPPVDGAAILLHVAVLDSPSPPAKQHTADILVPPGRESDWTFSTYEGHLQLLLASPDPLSRLVLLFNATAARRLLEPLLLALCPSGPPQRAYFLSYEDDVECSRVVQTALGPSAGEMLVEDVEIQGVLRRRLRFRRMPNLVQSQARATPHGVAVDADSLLLQTYLPPMVAGLGFAAPELERRGARGRVLCLGVGGGCLPMFLQQQMGLDVMAVEIDEVVLGIARRHFGFIEGDSLRVCVGDAIELLEGLGRGEKVGRWWECADKVDVVMVDLDSCDSKDGVIAPPVEFAWRGVVAGARAALCESGILVINVVPLDESYYLRLIGLFHEMFSEVYEMEVGNGENFVVVVTVLPVAEPVVLGRDGDCLLRKRLKEFMGSRLGESSWKKV